MIVMMMVIYVLHRFFTIHARITVHFHFSL